MNATHSYTTLDEGNFEQQVLQSGQPVLVDFYADWCQPCRTLAPVIEQLAAEFEGVARIGKVNVDENPALTERFGVQSIPALLLFQNGQVVEKVIGAASKSVLARKLTALAGASTED